MKTRPILFSGPMIRAILDGRKTQTRRVCKLDGLEQSDLYETRDGDQVDPVDLCPYGVPGDRLWVRESIEWEIYASQTYTGISYCADRQEVDADPPADWLPPRRDSVSHWESGDNIPGGGFAWYTGKVSSIFMPRWASRITLEIVAVRVERLQNISDGDVLDEGVEPLRQDSPDGNEDRPILHYPEAFRETWDSINGKRPRCAWADNPWVWALTFKRVTP